MNKTLQNTYTYHHINNRRSNFSILEQDRGALLNYYIGENKKVLDIGCRDGTLTKYFVKNNNVLGADIDASSLKIIEEKLNIQTLLMDLNSDWSELENKKFDVIVAGEILEHLYFPEIVIKKVKEHLNVSGVFIGSVPNAFSLKNRVRYLFANKKNTPLGDSTHINHFSYIEFKKILEKYFNNVEIIGLGKYKKLIKLSRNFFAFDLFFICK